MPLPPGPVSVTSRTSGRRRSSATSSISPSRPRNGVAGTGRFVSCSVFSGGKSSGAELEDPLGRAQVLQPVQTEVAHVRAGEVRRRLRQEHLPAVPGGRDPRRPMHVEPDIAFVDQERLPRMQPHPHAHPAARKGCLRICSRRHSVRRAREDDEERVPLRVDLDSVVAAPGFSQDAVVLGQHVGVLVTDLLQQPGRALDVGEEECHRPGRKLGVHPAILSRPGARRQRVTAGRWIRRRLGRRR